MQDNKHTQLWEQCLQQIKDKINAQQYDAWFKDITSMNFENGCLHLLVPSEFFAQQLELRFINLLGAAIRMVYGDGVKLYYHFQTVKDQPDTNITQLSERPSGQIIEQRANSQAANPFTATHTGDIDSQLNPKYTFSNYCGGESNKVVRSIAQAIADDPTNRTFNPLFIFGPVGVGKTHLMQAIGIGIKEKNPRQRVLYVTARLFENQYTEAVAKKMTNSFFRFYQSIDTLLIDDIQDLHHKPGTQNIFYHIFNHLHQNNKQIIMSCDRAPVEMEGFEDRLLSRFKWGMTAELKSPDLTLRRDVLVQKAEQNGLSLPAEVSEYIATVVTTSIRDLEGIMTSLVAHATLLNCPITLDLARNVIGNTVKVSARPINFDLLAQEVSTYYNIEPRTLFSKSRKREVSDARQILMYLARNIAKLPIMEIGKLLLRTHATVNYACNTIQERLQSDIQLQCDIRHIEAAVLGQ